MLFKIIVIFLAVCFISCVENDKPVIECTSDPIFLLRAKESLGETVGIVFTNQKNPMPAWIQDEFKCIVTKFLEITMKNGSDALSVCSKYFNNHLLPRFYVMQKGKLLNDSLLGADISVANRNRFAVLAKRADAKKRSETLVTVEFEALLKKKYAGSTVGSTSGSNAASTAVFTEETTTLGKRSYREYVDLNGPPGIDLNEPPNTDDYNSNMMTHTGGSETTYEFHYEFGSIYHYSKARGRSSTSPPATGSISKRPSTSTTALTDSSGNRRPSKSPSTGSGGTRAPYRSP